MVIILLCKSLGWGGTDTKLLFYTKDAWDPIQKGSRISKSSEFDKSTDGGLWNQVCYTQFSHLPFNLFLDSVLQHAEDIVNIYIYNLTKVFAKE